MSPITPPVASSGPIQRFYPIGTPGTPWTSKEDDEWKQSVRWHRSYEEEVVQKIGALKESSIFREHFIVEEYGCITIDESKTKKYPLYAIRIKEDWSNDDDSNKSMVNMLVTGGVHGYETSGVQGALLFMKQMCDDSDLQSRYLTKVRMCVVPCVTPWAYEHIQRWNADLMDPNRSFKEHDPAAQTKESTALMSYLKTITKNWHLHLDLHETTNTDLTEFMPAKHAKAGLPYYGEVIPDGFYVVGDDESSGRSKKEQTAFCQAVIASVAKVTHIAEPDDNGNIIDEPVVSDGIILVPVEQLGLCCSCTKAPFVTTTEVYPDSSRGISPDTCNEAQVAAIVGAMAYVLDVM